MSYTEHSPVADEWIKQKRQRQSQNPYTLPRGLVCVIAGGWPGKSADPRGGTKSICSMSTPLPTPSAH